MQAEARQLGSEERRRFNRVDVNLLGRFMREDRTEYPCRAENMSPGDVAITTAVRPWDGERIIVYIDHIGRLEGTVVRVSDGGFVLSLKSSERKREKLAAQLTWLANRHELDLPEDRRHERVEPENPLIDLVLEDGRRYQARIIDLSLSGAAVTSRIRPAIGSRITLGTTQGRVVRHLEEGFAIEFAATQSRETIERNLR
ncbi:MAG TPA: PilZ domain-containing protein [Aurantimonas sp.]|uniref:PilZ domain-containing protein n=1 Tax=Aurantimonas marianensis TaxID=2920428 RepID=A0A9X2H954_9HYPH|nr:PilZ domain-containing protein [Aurantimonas marianensis]MCP3055533.1 PilZ domain-containing protein [Aurantimonas marianensis]